MKDCEVCCAVKKNDSGEYILYPRANMDKGVLDAFVGSNGRWVNVRLMNRAMPKTYDQTKAFWGLFSIYFQIIMDRKPTTKELDFFYEELKPDLFPTRQSIFEGGKPVPKSWSQLTKEEGIEVIAKVMALISESNNVPDEYTGTCKDLFIWLQQEKNGLPKDPTDFHDDGTPLTKEEWAERNKLCMVNGIMGGDICHIVSRQQGMGYEWLIEQPWNYYRASHNVHIEVQHRLGWDALFEMAPWIKGRYERAFKMFYRGRDLKNKNFSEEEIIDILCKEDAGESYDKVEPKEEKSLAMEALF